MIQAFIAAIIALAALLGLQTVRLSNEQAAHAKTVAKFAQEKQQAADKLSEATTKARETEQAMQAKANTDRRQADEAIKSLTRQRNALRAERLRNNAATTITSLPSAPISAGAAQISTKPDSAQLSGSIGSAEEDEALRADIIRIELLSCYAIYDRARNQSQEQGKP